MPAANSSPLHEAAQMCVLSGAVALDRAGDTLPTRIKILNWGDNVGRTTKALIKVSEVSLSQLPAYQEATASEIVGVDFEHQSVPKHPNYTPDPRDMAGHGKIEIVAEDGVYLSAVDYTPAGKRYAPNYPDVSAHVFLDKQHNLIFVRSVALTQHGDVSGMEFSEAAAACALCPPVSLSSQPTPNMDTNTPDPVTPDYREMLVKILKLKPAEGEDKITDEELAAALDTYAETHGEPRPPAPTAPDSEVAMSARLDQVERRQILSDARAAGKIIPISDEVAATLSTVALSALVSGLTPGEVPTGPTAASADRPSGTQEVALSAEQSTAAKALGLTPEQYRAALS